MTIDVSVDDTDILSLSEGQTATVTIDSLDQTVDGTITDIDKTGTTSDGVTYYTAEVTIDKADGMLSGMSASVVISIQSVDDAILIPVEALNNTGSTYFVYTTLDEDTDTPGGMVEVTVGITNSTYVQITSGLSEGDTVYMKTLQLQLRRRHERYDGNAGRRRRLNRRTDAFREADAFGRTDA